MRIFVGLWVSVILAGFYVLMTYQSTPGEAAEVQPSWPATTALEHQDNRLNLVMFVHPHCPCSTASMRELERIMVRLRDRVFVQVVFVRPKGAPSQWSDTSLVASARAIPKAEIRMDLDSQEAQRFGAMTSGHVYLYAADGALLFSGGITSSRAHEGDNLGSLTIQNLGMGEKPHKASTPVYGCPLFDRTTKQI